jgi:hypothetical protein
MTLLKSSQWKMVNLGPPSITPLVTFDQHKEELLSKKLSSSKTSTTTTMVERKSRVTSITSREEGKEKTKDGPLQKMEYESLEEMMRSMSGGPDADPLVGLAVNPNGLANPTGVGNPTTTRMRRIIRGPVFTDNRLKRFEYARIIGLRASEINSNVKGICEPRIDINKLVYAKRIRPEAIAEEELLQKVCPCLFDRRVDEYTIERCDPNLMKLDPFVGQLYY